MANPPRSSVGDTELSDAEDDSGEESHDEDTDWEMDEEEWEEQEAYTLGTGVGHLGQPEVDWGVAWDRCEAGAKVARTFAPG